MNPQTKKINPINKLIPSGSIKTQLKNPSTNLPMGTPTQSKRPLIKNQFDKSPKNQGNYSARGEKNLNLKGSSSNFSGLRTKNDQSRNSLIESNRMNSAGKGIDKLNVTKKSNPNLNLFGVIKGKYIKIYLF